MEASSILDVRLLSFDSELLSDQVMTSLTVSLALRLIDPLPTEHLHVVRVSDF